MAKMFQDVAILKYCSLVGACSDTQLLFTNNLPPLDSYSEPKHLSFLQTPLTPTRLFGSYTLIFWGEFFPPARLLGPTRLFFPHFFAPLHGY